jgi:PAS domain S-box-containing protein
MSDLSVPEATAGSETSQVTRRRRAYLRFASLASFAVVVIGLLVLAGWLLHLDPLTEILPGHSPTNPVTAIALVGSGAALELIRSGGRRARLLGLALALIVCAVGLIRFGSWIGAWPLGIDQWMSLGRLRDPVTRLQNRMAPNSALAFALFGGAMVCLALRDRRWVVSAQVIAVGLMLVSMLSAVGHLLNATPLYEVEGTNPMGLPTAVAFSLLSLSLLFGSVEQGLMGVITGSGLAGDLARRLLPACLILPIVIGLGMSMANVRGTIDQATSLALTVILTSAAMMGLVWYHAAALDRSEHRGQRAAEALRQSEMFYHALVESLPQSILRKDAEGRFTFVNQRFCETMDRRLEDVLQRTDHDFYPASLADKYRRDDRRVMEERETLDIIEQNVTPDGQEHYVHVIKSPLRDAADRVIGVQVIFWDVTGEILAERRLVEQNEQLRVMAESERQAHEERKRAQAQMIQTAKLAGLGQVVAGVAHEINNPLAFVSNNMAVLQRDLADVHVLLTTLRDVDPVLAAHAPEARRRVRALWEQADVDYLLENLPGLLGRTRDGIDRIQRIVSDLRAFARMDDDAFVEVDLSDRIRSTVHILDGRAKSRQVRLTLEIDSLPRLRCRPGKIDQVIMNLVSNAIEACDVGGTVSVRARCDGARLILEVEDDGCGIDAATRERIFDPFFTTKAVGEGTGLGLSISYGIVRDHGGTIEVASTVGVGSCFRVFLPVRGDSGDVETPVRSDEPRQAEALT